ncbi:unnamed protein product [Penicillium pancosmium]
MPGATMLQGTSQSSDPSSRFMLTMLGPGPIRRRRFEIACLRDALPRTSPMRFAQRIVARPVKAQAGGGVVVGCGSLGVRDAPEGVVYRIGGERWRRRFTVVGC